MMEKLGNDLNALNEYLKSVIDLVPAHSYFKQVQPATKNGPKKKSQKKKTCENEEDGKKGKKRKFTANFMKTTSAQIADEVDDDEGVAYKKIRGGKWAEGEAGNYSELKKRLHDKMAEIRAQRNPKNRSPEEMEKIRSRRKKEREKLKLRKKLKHQQNLNTGSVAAEMQGKPGQKKSKAEKLLAAHPENSEGKAVFSKFDFGNEIESKKRQKKLEKKAKKDKNLKFLLSEVESKKRRLEELKTTNPDQADSVVRKESWGKAMAKAEGTRIKDDPELLKKSIKKEKAIKRQHAKKWKEREDNVKDKMEKRQEKRAKNIQARKDQNKDKKKAKRAKKMSKSIPGF